MSPVIPHFELSEEIPAQGVHIISVSGEIHVQTAPRFAQRFNAAIDGGSDHIVLDLSAVEFIDSTGLSVLLNGLRLVTQRLGSLALVLTNPTVMRLFQITSLDQTFDIFDNRAAAVAQVSAASSAGAP